MQGLKAKLASGNDEIALDYILSLTDTQQKDLIVDLSTDAGSADDLSRLMGFFEKLEDETIIRQAGETEASHAANGKQSGKQIDVTSPNTKQLEGVPPGTPKFPSGGSNLPPNAAEAGGCGCGPGGGCSVM
jgi:hypothetical protein